MERESGASDRFMAYRQGWVPPEQRARIADRLARLRRWTRLGLAGWVVLVPVAFWTTQDEVQSPNLDTRVSAAVRLALLVITAVVGLCWAAWYLMRLRTWRHELAGGTVVQAEGEIAWRTGHCGAFRSEERRVGKESRRRGS